MVTFTLKHQDSHKLTYHYYPNGNTDAGHGTITVFIDEGRIDVTVLAENDRLVLHTKESMNAMRETANNLRILEQLPPLTEEEWPIATEDRTGTLFADFAIKTIVEAYNAGTILREGFCTEDEA